MNIFNSALTFIAGAKKKEKLALRTSQILLNRHELSTPVLPEQEMSQNIQEPSPQSPVTSRFTGFREPFSSDRNTTLAHPDANTGPNATIEGPDIALERRNSRRGFGKYGRLVSSGKIPLAEREVRVSHDNIQYADTSSLKSPIDKETLSPILTRETIGRASSSGESKTDGDSGVFMNKDEIDEQGYREGERKKGVLRKLGLHKV